MILINPCGHFKNISQREGDYQTGLSRLHLTFQSPNENVPFAVNSKIGQIVFFGTLTFPEAEDS